MELQALVNTARGYAPKRDISELSQNEIDRILAMKGDRHVSGRLVATAHRVSVSVIKEVWRTFS